ncbi:uncharacterized protein TNCV_1209271 [Trichonephila clavipes]|nr:uncharacterized protein TNCV_1209271 [Trichonephila clavipes]
MSERSRLPDLLRWRVVRWMEMGLSQANAARRLNVSRSVVHHLWNRYQTEASVFRRHVLGLPRATTPAGDRFIALLAQKRRISVPQLVADHSVASGRRISTSMVQRHLHNSGLYARPGSDGLLYSLQKSPDSHWRAIQDVCSSGGNKAPDIVNPTLLKDTVTEEVE